MRLHVSHGTFVLALPIGKNFCAVHVRRVDTAAAIRLFTALIANPSQPFTSARVKSERTRSPVNGQIETRALAQSLRGNLPVFAQFCSRGLRNCEGVRQSKCYNRRAH